MILHKSQLPPRARDGSGVASAAQLTAWNPAAEEVVVFRHERSTQGGFFFEVYGR